MDGYKYLSELSHMRRRLDSLLTRKRAYEALADGIPTHPFDEPVIQKSKTDNNAPFVKWMDKILTIDKEIADTEAELKKYTLRTLGMIGKIEKAILDANVGLTPSNNGEIIRCMVPALTEERRKDLIKKAKAQGETTKVGIRNARRDGIDMLKKAQKNEGLSEDGEKEGEAELQKVTDKWVKRVDEIIAAKEKDILTV